MGLFRKVKDGVSELNPLQGVSLQGVGEHPQRRLLIGVLAGSVVVALVFGVGGYMLASHRGEVGAGEVVPSASSEATYIDDDTSVEDLEAQAAEEALAECGTSGVVPEGACSNKYGFVDVAGINLGDMEHNMLFRPLSESERTDARKFAQWAVEAMGTSREQAANLIPYDVNVQWRKYLTNKDTTRLSGWSEDFHENVFDLYAFGRDEDVKYAVTYVSGVLPTSMCGECSKYWGSVWSERGMSNYRSKVVRVDVQILNDSAMRNAWYEDELSVYILFSDMRASAFASEYPSWKIETAWAIPQNQVAKDAQEWKMVEPANGLPLPQWGGTFKTSDQE